MDGYYLIEMEELFNSQMKLNIDISNLTEDMRNLPTIPTNMESWIESIPDLNSNGFKLEDFKKIFKINKEYNNLMEKREENSHKLKIIAIDNLIDRIKDIIK
jgi:hypothetical protein